MVPSDTIQGMNYFPSENPSIFPSNFGNLPAFQFGRFLANLPNYHTELITPNSACISSNSTSDEAEDNQVAVIDERKQRRMISNRESARRSRMRKQRHLDELWCQVLRLRTDNHNLIDKLNSVSESHQRVVQENARLREEASDLRRMVVSNSYTVLSDPGEIPCDRETLQTTN